MNLVGIGNRKETIKDEGIIDFDDTVVKEISQVDLDEQRRIDSIISGVYAASDKRRLTDIYTQILADENVAQILKALSMERIFQQHFPEFYVYNKYGENVFNCVQSSSYHRYDLFKHITTTIEEVGKNSLTLGEGKRKILNWTMLLHDLGKPYVKVKFEEGGESFAGHEDKSYELSIDILDRFDFNEEDKKTILTLVKYHDKYLNEGELTYANLKELALALDNSKEKFNLLIMVKDADAAAKSIEVYQKYKISRLKYIEFMDNYFEDLITVSDSGENLVVNSSGLVNEEKEEKEEEFSNIEYDSIIDGIIDRTKIEPLYQPIINVEEGKVIAYEVLSKIKASKKLDIEKLLKYAEETSQYNKVQQMLFIHGLESFAGITLRESNRVNVNINIKSYEMYVNKPRIYELMDKAKVTLEIHGYERYDLPSLQNFITEIHKKNGKVALDHFGTGIMNTNDFRMITPDSIKLDRSITTDILENEDKQKFVLDLQTMCYSKDIELIAVGVENRDVMNKLRQLGVKYMQGFYLAKPSSSIDFINEKLDSVINSEENDSIV
ncbi:MAG: EAL domain-containing protein [Clostridia bacterium]|nr:EAL domain-containing protein [Clostridia bacterium]